MLLFKIGIGNFLIFLIVKFKFVVLVLGRWEIVDRRWEYGMGEIVLENGVDVV